MRTLFYLGIFALGCLGLGVSFLAAVFFGNLVQQYEDDIKN